MRNQIVLILILFFISTKVNSQSFNWAKGMGGGYAYSNSITIDRTGNVYTTGSFDGISDFDPGPGTSKFTSAGYDDIFISKLSAAGNFIWAKRVGGTGIDRAQSIACDDSGNVYTAGYFNGTVDFDPGTATFNLTSTGKGDIFVSKLNSAGSFVWAKIMGDTADDYLMSLTVDSIGNVYITGQFKGTVDFDPGSANYNLTSTGDYDIFLSKLTPDGNFVWAKNIGGSLGDNGNYIRLDASGNLFITGYFFGTVDFDPSPGTANLVSAGRADIFILKCDTSGTFKWSVNLGGSEADYAQAITLDAAGNIYTTGYFTGTADFNPGSGTNTITAPYTDVFISKLDASGNYIWARSLGGSSTTYCKTIAVDALGNVYTAGTFYNTGDFDPGTGTHNLTSKGSGDIFISKLNSAGNFVSAFQIGSKSYNGDFAYSIASTDSGDLYVTGYYSDSVDFDPGSGTYYLAPLSGKDIFVLKLSSTPSSAGTITGPPIVCASSEMAYSISPVADATGYLWTVPSGATITSGQNTTSIFVIFGTGSGKVTVTPTNSFGYGVPSTLAITVKALPGVGATIIPSTTVCVGTQVTFLGTGATSYSWSGGITNGVPFTANTSFTTTVTGTDGNGCTNTFTVSVTVIPFPVISTQPVNQSVTDSNDALFTTNASASATYQWQQNSGSGFINLTNTGQFSGVDTKVLKISAVTLAQNNYSYRCIIKEGNCSTITNAAVLSVTFKTGIESHAITPDFSIYPNPSPGIITIQLNDKRSDLNFTILDNMGRSILTGGLGNKETSIDISALAAGFYYLRLADTKAVLASSKLLKQ